MNNTIVVVEDDAVQRLMITTLLEKKFAYKVLQSANGRDAVDLIKASTIGDIAVVLMDISMPVMDGFEALREIRALRPDLPVIMLTGNDDVNVAVRAIKEGASDFILKPPIAAQLEVAIKNAIKLSSLTQEITRLRRDKSGELGFDDLIGNQGGLKNSVSAGRKAASSDVPVLISGETGVGKELFARALHGESRRVGKNFIAINCGALPENLVESILFGHEKGSFTGATTKTIGKFREADNGTIFLDEIGELPLDSQVKLLRVLQQKEVEPVGSGKPVKVNVRIISATNRDLETEVRNKRFREDLYFRLNVLPIKLPPLRQRREDIIKLAEYFINRLAASESAAVKTLTPDAIDYLKECSWPGNVRELENLIHRALVMSEGDSISASELSLLHSANAGRYLEQNSTPQSAISTPENADLQISLRNEKGIFKTMREIEAESMQKILAHYDNNITKAADILGIAKSTFYRKIKNIE